MGVLIMSVNISGKQLQQEGIVCTVDRILAESGMN